MTDHDSSLEPLRKRLDDELAAGKTVVLGPSELDDPQVRERLPALLEQLSASHRRQSLSSFHLPGYTLLGEIGRGGMSAVHLARHEALGRVVAVKITPNWLASDPRSRERLVREARSLALVSHPNIVHVYDVVDDAQGFAIAMEWVDGQTLSGLVRSLPATPGSDDMAILRARLGTPPRSRSALEPTTTRTFVRMMRDIAAATQAVHDAGLLHLDIKPSNVLVRRDGTPLLADFGVVRELTTEQTHTRTFAGTPIYAAPEQLRRDDAHIGPHTDVYAIGLTLFEALAREQPLRDLDMASIARTVESGRFPPLREFAELPADLANIVQMAIAPEPGNRYPSAAALAADLTAFLEDRPVIARPLSRSQRLRRWLRAEPWKALLAAALLVLIPVLLGLGGYLAWQWPELERLRIEKVMAEATRLRHDAFQGIFLVLQNNEEVADTLSRAVEIDPSPKTIASHLLAESYSFVALRPQVIARYRRHIAADPALQAIVARIEDGRSFFDDEEVARFADSARDIDHFVLAIDRVMRARSSYDHARWADAEAAVQRVVLRGERDQLMFGLLALCRAEREDAPGVALTLQAMHDLWPDGPETATWAAGIAVVTHSSEAPAAIADLVAIAPDQPITAAIVLRSRVREVERHAFYDLARQWLDAERPSGYVKRMLLYGAASTWAQPFFHACAELFPRWGMARTAAIPTLTRRPDQAPQLFEIVSREHPTPDALMQLVDSALTAGHMDLATKAVERLEALTPDRTSYPEVMIEHLLRSKQLEKGAALARVWQPDRSSMDQAIYQVTLLASANDWRSLRDAARHWFDNTTGETRRQAATYVALAESRLGDHVAAAEFMGIALSVEMRRRNWVDTWMESAWLHVAPDSPPGLHDAKLAMRHLESWQEFGSKFGYRLGGAWAECVWASVLDANDDREQAIAHARRARAFLRQRRQMPGIPDIEFIEQQLQRIEQR